ncbi:hypothetical protein Tco_0241967 [Tanacetum coccineum]
MIGSLVYLTASRLDIMFAVCTCARFQVTPKTSHLLAVKRIFIYLKGKPTLGLWYSMDSPFELVAYTDSDYVGATQDRKSITRGCQFLGNRLISWQYKKQTVVATSTTKAEYVAAANLLTKGLLRSSTRFHSISFFDSTSHPLNPKKKHHLKKTRTGAEISQDETKHKESVPTPSNDPQPSSEDSMQLTDLMDEELMFDTGVLDTDEMPVEAKVDEKDEQSTKLDDSTAGEAVTTASVEDMRS